MGRCSNRSTNKSVSLQIPKSGIIKSMDSAKPIRFVGDDRAHTLLSIGTSIIEYSNGEYLQDDIQWFKSHDYVVYEINGNVNSGTKESFLKDLQVIPGIGMHSLNLDSFNDSLRDLPITGPGIIFLFKHIEALLQSPDIRFLVVLDILDGYSRRQLLDGKRVITLIQADNPHSNVGRIGARSAQWNPREWLYTNRKVDAENIKNYEIPWREV